MAVSDTMGSRATEGRSSDMQSRLLGLLLGVGLATIVGLAFWFATQRAADQSSVTNDSGASVVIVDCPAEIVINTSPLCGISTENIVEAQWEIAGFGAGNVEKIDTEWQMFINPTNAEVIGLDFVLVVRATDRDGDQLEARHRFEVVE